ncbi:hypothetical protein [Paractinoplanes globisporus]|uniref:Uncharacterized protein n=1 Tax=Paractinoplanes globisporus TaxID=113565 RepID=A0ABW6WHW0_9ACTN|nr:hypothetical protein [Actinoplanes globisporus]
MSVGSPSKGEPVGVSLGHRELSEADHWILSLSPAPAFACTHLVPVPYRHVAISLSGFSKKFRLNDELRPAAEAALAGKFGRAVVFPGSDKLVGPLTVGELLEVSAIDKVEVLGSGAASPDDRLDTRDFVRPQFRSGELILTATPAAGGVLVPFETRNPTPCCANH